MTTSAQDARTRTPRLVLAILVIGIIATPVLAFPYVLLDRSASRIDVQTDLAWALLVVHVPTAAAALLLGALQLVPRIRADRRRHRIIGRTFLADHRPAGRAVGHPPVANPAGGRTVLMLLGVRGGRPGPSRRPR